MRVVLLGKNEAEWLAMCDQFGMTVTANAVHEVTAIPGIKTRMSEYMIDDHCALATWVSLKRPEWLTEIWRQTPSFLHTDHDETFLKMNPHAQP